MIALVAFQDLNCCKAITLNENISIIKVLTIFNSFPNCIKFCVKNRSFTNIFVEAKKELTCMISSHPSYSTFVSRLSPISIDFNKVPRRGNPFPNCGFVFLRAK